MAQSSDQIEVTAKNESMSSNDQTFKLIAQVIKSNYEFDTI